MPTQWSMRKMNLTVIRHLVGFKPKSSNFSSVILKNKEKFPLDYRKFENAFGVTYSKSLKP